MGRLITIPNNELVGTLQALDGDGVTSEHFEQLRGDPAYRAAVVAVFLSWKNSLDLSVGNAGRFLREFCGVIAYVGVPPGSEPKGHWAIPCAEELTYKRLATLIVEKQVPHCEGTPTQLRQVDATFDCRRAEDGNYLLFTPAGVEATKACPQFVEISYRQLWGDKSKLTCREAVILWLFVWWTSRGKVLLDIKGWTRTSSRSLAGYGVSVNSYNGRLHVGLNNPDIGDLDSSRFAVSP